MSIEEEVRRMAQANCDHICHHGRGLNPWIVSCPYCGCRNPKHDPAAVSDIEAPQFGIFSRAFPERQEYPPLVRQPASPEVIARVQQKADERRRARDERRLNRFRHAEK